MYCYSLFPRYAIHDLEFISQTRIHIFYKFPKISNSKNNSQIGSKAYLGVVGLCCDHIVGLRVIPGSIDFLRVLDHCLNRNAQRILFQQVVLRVSGS